MNKIYKLHITPKRKIARYKELKGFSSLSEAYHFGNDLCIKYPNDEFIMISQEGKAYKFNRVMVL